MKPTIGQVLAVLPAHTQRGKDFRTVCPACQKRHLDVTDKAGTVVVNCKTPGCSSAWKLIQKKLSTATAQKVVEPAPPRKKTGDWDTAPWDEWGDERGNGDLTKETYAKIVAMRDRDDAGYMPQFKTLCTFGFRQLNWKGSTIVGYPIAGWPPTVDCIKWFLPKPKSKPKHYFDGPYRKQDRLFGLGVMPPSNVEKHFRTQPRLGHKFSAVTDSAVFIVEGQWDAMALHEMGYRAYALLSSGQREIVGGILKGLDESAEYIFIMCDNDAPGQACSERFANLIPGKTFVVQYPKDVHDMCALLADDVHILEGIDDALAGAIAQGMKQKAIGNPAPIPLKLLSLTWGNESKPTVTKWLWKNRIPADVLNVFGGMKGDGKSACALDLVARITRGDAFPDDKPNRIGAGRVIIFCEESNWESEILPRLLVNKAREDYFAHVNGVPNDEGTFGRLELSRHLPIIEATLQNENAKKDKPPVRLLVLDPISGYFGSGKRLDKQEDIRPILEDFAKVAARMHCTVLAISHLNKDEKIKELINRLFGSVSIGATFRNPMIFARDPDNPGTVVIQWERGNLIPYDTQNMQFHFDPRPVRLWNPETEKWEERDEDGDKHMALGIVWDGVTDKSVNTLLGGGTGEKRLTAKEWLEQELDDHKWHKTGNDGSRAGEAETDFYKQGKEAGFSSTTLKHAWGKGKLPVIFDRFRIDGKVRQFVAWGKRPNMPPDCAQEPTPLETEEQDAGIS